MTARLARDFPERSTVLARGFGRVLDRATLAGGVAAVGAVVVFSIAMRARLPWEFTVLASGVIGTVAGLAVTRLFIPTRLLRAYEAFSWLGRSEMDRFEARTGSKVPVQRDDVERWLEANPPSPATHLGRVEILAYVGRTDEARAELDAVVATSPELASERASLVQYIGWLADGDARLDELRAAVANLTLDAHHRSAADVTIGVAEARERSMRGDPAWALPLERVRPSLGSAPRRVVLRDTWRPIATLYLVTAIAASIFGFLLPGLP